MSVSLNNEIDINNNEYIENSIIYKLKFFPSIIIDIINKLHNDDQKSNALSCKMMLVLSSFPLGKCANPIETRHWTQILQEDFSKRDYDLSSFKWPKIVETMSVLKWSNSQDLSLPAPTVQFFIADLPEDSTEQYIRRGLQLKLARNSYLNSVVQQIKNSENIYKSNYYIFYHSCSLTTYIYTEFSKCLIEIVNMGIQKNMNPNLQQIEKLSWFRFPQFKPHENPSLVSDLLSKYSMEAGESFDDHAPQLQNLLMSVVPCLFSSLSDPGECSWNFFEDNRSVNPLPHEKYFNLLCNHFHLLPCHSDREKFLTSFSMLHRQFCTLANGELKNIHKSLKVKDCEDGIDPKGVICQILVPHQIAEKVLYFSKPYGFVDHTLDSLPFSDQLRTINTNPWQYQKSQFRFLAHHLYNLNSGIILKNYGYGNFFDSDSAINFRTQIYDFFLKVLIKTVEV